MRNPFERQLADARARAALPGEQFTPYYQGSQGPPRGYQERLEELTFGLAPKYSGLSQYMGGGAYGPERILSLWADQMGAAPQMQAASAGSGMPYAMQAMNLASRAAATQAANAQRLAMERGGFSGAAMGGIGRQIAAGAGENIGNVGAQALSQGWGLQQQANTQNLGAALQERMGQMGLFSGALQRGYGASTGMMDSFLNQMQQQMAQRDQRRLQERQMRMGALGMLGSTIGRFIPALGGGMSPTTMGGVDMMGLDEFNRYNPVGPVSGGW